MGFNSTQIRTFNDLGEALIRQYKYNVDMALDRDQLHATSQKDKETFKEYAQRWREISAQVSLSLEEKEITKLFLKTLSSFYYDRMVASAPNDFTEMVNMGKRLEEGVSEGLLVKESGSYTRTPPVIPKEFPWWYKSDHHCEFHQGAPDHDIENCFALKVEVRRLVQSGILSFEDSGPNVQANPFPKHGGATVNMVVGCNGKYDAFDVNLIRRFLVEMHATLCKLSHYENDHVSCCICSRNPRGCVVVKRDLQEMLDQNLIHITRDRDEDEHGVNAMVPHFNIPKRVVIAFNSQKSVVSPLVICLAGHTPYESDIVVPYKYNATMLEDGKEIPIPSLSFIVNIADVSGVIWSCRVFAYVSLKRIEDTSVGKQAQVETPVVQSDKSSGVNQKSYHDEVLKLIKRSEFNMKVLEQAYVDHDVTIGQFDSIVANITTCKNISFSDEELLEQGRNHNLALHISMNCQEDALSNVLVDTGFSLNVMPKCTLSKLSYQGDPMRFNGVVMKAFDGSKKNVIGEVDLPLKIGLCLFQITFQVMDIHPAYSCLLGRPWIHEVGEVTSTLHQKLKLVKNGKLVIVGGE
ncbi:uncharacterized protein LOC127135924 [Lathyrus oleraceus]|uniref:uncharacterized protein LOC127135924 n=1 Tax=Pisum sativum TaxID=3888 RepID=UPI0021D1DA68|nr:uncharacterized protein LOC127135924 [Pisum sativum]